MPTATVLTPDPEHNGAWISHVGETTGRDPNWNPGAVVPNPVKLAKGLTTWLGGSFLGIGEPINRMTGKPIAPVVDHEEIEAARAAFMEEITKTALLAATFVPGGQVTAPIRAAVAAVSKSRVIAPVVERVAAAAAKISRPLAAKGATRGRSGHGYAREVLPGGRPDGQTVFAGHGGYRYGAGDAVVPEGTTLHVYSDFGDTIDDSLGRAIETGGDVAPVQIFAPGSTIPNYTLRAPNRLRIHEGSTTVEDSTDLSELLQPNMGVCHWAACTEAW